MISKSKLYDLIYDKADRLFKQYNPCNIQKDKSGKITCSYKHSSNRLCCHVIFNGGCKYYSENGCTTQCLPCKLYYCGAKPKHLSHKEYDIFRKKIQALRSESYQENLSSFRFYFMSKKEIFRRLNSVSKSI